MRDRCIAFIERTLADRPELIEKVIRKAPPPSSRPTRIDALAASTAELVSDRIERITPVEIVTGGVGHPVGRDRLATGFRANDKLYRWPRAVAVVSASSSRGHGQTARLSRRDAT